MNIDIVKKIQDIVISMLGELSNKKDIFHYVKIILENVEHENLKGNEKKKLAIRILEDLIKESSMDNSHKIYNLSLIEHGVISNSIDLIISAASGDLEVNMKTTESLCNKFFIPCSYAAFNGYVKSKH